MNIIVAENRRFAARLVIYALSLQPTTENIRGPFDKDRVDFLEELLLLSTRLNQIKYARAVVSLTCEANTFLSYIRGSDFERFNAAAIAHANKSSAGCEYDASDIDIKTSDSLHFSNNDHASNFDFKMRALTAILEAEAIAEVADWRVRGGAHAHVKIAIAKAILELSELVPCEVFRAQVLKEMRTPRPVPYRRLSEPMCLFAPMTTLSRLGVLSLFPEIDNDTEFFSGAELDSYAHLHADVDVDVRTEAIVTDEDDGDELIENAGAAPSAAPAQTRVTVADDRAWLGEIEPEPVNEDDVWGR
jgi:hypothetical protein